MEDKKKVLRKIDLHLLLPLILLYVSVFLNRINLANIHTPLTTDLAANVDESTFSWSIIVFFIPFTVFEIPGNLLIRRWRAKYLGLIGILCSILISLLGAFGSGRFAFLFSRSLLGLMQAGGLLFMISLWFRPEERGFRFSLLVGSSIMTSSISGLLGYAILSSPIGGVLGMPHWRWVLILESIPALLFGIWMLVSIPRDPLDGRFCWLSFDEKYWLSDRLMLDASVEPESFVDDDDESTSLLRDGVVKSFPQTSPWTISTISYMVTFSFLYFIACIPNTALMFFLPKMLEFLGYSTITANLLVVPMTVSATILTILLSWKTDGENCILQKSWSAVACFWICVLGFVLVLCTGFENLIPFESATATSMALIGSWLGVCGMSPLTSFLASLAPFYFVTPGRSPVDADQKRVVDFGTALMVTMGGVGGVLTPQLYNSFEENRYRMAHAIVAGCTGFGAILLTLLVYFNIKRLACKK